MGVEAAVVVGHSMGGLVATALAQNSSQLVDRVAVISTPNSISEDGALPLTARLSYTPVLGEAIWRLAPDSLIKKSYEDAFAPGFDYEAAFEDPDQVLRRQRGDDLHLVQAGRLRERGLHRRGDRLGADQRGRRAVHGDPRRRGPDRRHRRRLAEAYRGIPGAEVTVLPGVGHSAELEEPDKTVALIEGFAKDAPSPADLAKRAMTKKLKPIPGMPEAARGGRPRIGGQGQASRPPARARTSRSPASKQSGNGG